jgi:hypothetical protein
MLGIQFKPSPPYKHSINSVAEKAIELVNRRARLIIFQAKLPKDMWDYAVEHAVYLKNRVLTDTVPGRTPFKAFTDRKPAVSKLRVFGCAAYPINPKETYPKKYDPRFKNKTYIIVRISGSSIYRLLSLKNLKEIMAANVAFNKYVFPASQLQGPEPSVSNPVSWVKDRIQPSGQQGAAPEASGHV